MLGRGAANVWPLSMFFGGLAASPPALLHRSAQVTAIAVGSLVGMYVIDLVGKLADAVEPLRYVSVFRYYGSAIQDGIDPVAFAAVTLAGIALAIAGAATVPAPGRARMRSLVRSPPIREDQRDATDRATADLAARRRGSRGNL